MDCVNATNAVFNDINLSGTRITDANLTGLEIDGAQWGGGLIRNVGSMPPDWHPDYREGQRPKPLRFLNCAFPGAVFADCDLSGVALRHCRSEGMTIDGIPVAKLLEAYKQMEREPNKP